MENFDAKIESAIDDILKEQNYSLDAFAQQYVKTALWLSTDDNGNPLDDNYDIRSISPDSLKIMVDDCSRFQAENAVLMEGLEPKQCGHDFWLTRNGHGAGFWDRGLGEIGDKLTAAAEAFGESNIYIGDDGRLYVANG